MKTAGRDSAAFRDYLQFHLDEESDMKAVLLKIKNIAQSETDGEAAELAAMATEPPNQIRYGTSSADSTRSGTVRCPGGDREG